MLVLKKEKIKSLTLSIVMIILGVLFCVVPTKSLSVIETISSALLIACGLVFLLSYCFSPLMFRDSTLLVKAILTILLGLMLSFIPSIFVFGVGLIVAFNGLERFAYAFDIKEIGDKKWWIDFVAGLVIFLLGVTAMILCNTNVASNIVMIYFGTSIILNGVINLILIFALNRSVKKIKKFVKESEEGFTDYKVK